MTSPPSASRQRSSLRQAVEDDTIGAAQNLRQPSQVDVSLESEISTIVVGDVSRWEAEGRHLPLLKGFQFVQLPQLTPELLQQLDPKVVLSPLVSDQFDAVEVAQVLQECGHRGRYRAVTEAIPNPKMILREIRGTAKGLDVDLLILPQAAANDS